MKWGTLIHFFKLSGSEWYEIWSGGQSQYRLNNLASNTLYRFKLEVYDQSNRLIDTAIINTSTHKSEQDISSYLQSNAQMLSTFSDEQAEISYPMVDSNVTVVIYQDRVKLNWSNIPTENNEFEIYRNGEHLAEIEGNEYVDKNVKNSEPELFITASQMF